VLFAGQAVIQTDTVIYFCSYTALWLSVGEQYYDWYNCRLYELSKEERFEHDNMRKWVVGESTRRVVDAVMGNRPVELLEHLRLSYTVLGGPPYISIDSVDVHYPLDKAQSFIGSDCALHLDGLSRAEGFSVLYTLFRNRFLLFPWPDYILVVGES
jgi:hypothetical protein